MKTAYDYKREEQAQSGKTYVMVHATGWTATHVRLDGSLVRGHGNTRDEAISNMRKNMFIQSFNKKGA